MKKTAKNTEADQQYAAAHEAHCDTKDLAEALGRYRAVMDAHPETPAARVSH
jgi:hypothetical protein